MGVRPSCELRPRIIERFTYRQSAFCERRTIVFIDESGLSERPHRVRTWAPRGQTPVLQYHFNWKVLSAVAGITWWNFYFRLYQDTIRRCGALKKHCLKNRART